MSLVEQIFCPKEDEETSTLMMLIVRESSNPYDAL